MFFSKLDAAITKLLEIITGVSLVIAVALTLIQVIYRYALQQPLSWSQEVVMMAFVYSVLFGAALAIKNSEHLTVDLYEKIPKAFSVFLQILEFVVVGIMIIILLYFGYELVMSNFRSGQILGILPIQKAYVYLAVPLSALFMLYFHVKKVFS